MTENDQLSSRPNRQALQSRLDPDDSIIDVLPLDNDSFSSLRGYWEILFKHRWEILTSVFVVLTLAIIYTFKMKPVYSATARVSIESETPEIQSVNEMSSNIPTDEAFLETQVQVLESDNLAWQTIQQLRLTGNPEFNPELGSEDPKASDERMLRDRVMKKFKSALSVSLVRNTHMVEANFESTDPSLAANVANNLIKNYLEFNFTGKYEATRQASDWMGRQLDELKAKVEKSQTALVDYERKNSIVNVSDKQSVAELRLEELDKNLTDAQSDRAQKESLYDLVRSDESKAAYLAEDPLLEKLGEKFADLKDQYTEARAQYGPNFPKVVRLQDQVNELQDLIDKERQNAIDRIRNNYVTAVRRENLVSTSEAEQKAEVGRLNQLLIQENILKHDFDTKEQLYENLSQRLADATVSAGLRATNVHQVDQAYPPAIPIRPRKLLNLAVGFLGGLLLGVSLAFLLEGLEHSTVKTAEDVERIVNATCLALIPAAHSVGARSTHKLSLRATSKSSQNGNIAMTVLRDPSSPLAESYRALRSAILFSTSPQPPQALVVTSAQPNEGKTSTSLNLAAVLAQNGARVVLVEGDMRNPGITKALGWMDKKGLSGVLTGAHKLEEALFPIDSNPDFWVLPAGPHPPNPAELLSSSTMGSVLKELRQRFEFVVVDSPPLLLVTDATVLSTFVDGVVLVAECGLTAPAALIRAHRTLCIAGGRVLGVVINKVTAAHTGYYYGQYSKYYGAYYGSQEKEHASAKS